MTSHSTVVPLHQPGEIDDPLTEVLRSGARRLLPSACFPPASQAEPWQAPPRRWKRKPKPSWPR